MAGENIGTIFIAHPEMLSKMDVVVDGIPEVITSKDSEKSISSNNQNDTENSIKNNVEDEIKVEVEVALGAKAGSRQLQSLKSEDRVSILLHMAESLDNRLDEILAANAMDVDAAKRR